MFWAEQAKATRFSYAHMIESRCCATFIFVAPLTDFSKELAIPACRTNSQRDCKRKDKFRLAHPEIPLGNAHCRGLLALNCWPRTITNGSCPESTVHNRLQCLQRSYAYICQAGPFIVAKSLAGFGRTDGRAHTAQV